MKKKTAGESLARKAVSSAIKSYVDHQNLGKVFTANQVVRKKGISEEEKPAALRELSRLVKSEKIVRLANGSYYRPRKSRFGLLPIETEELVKVVTKTKSAAITPAGVAAINALGLDTQLPMVKSYVISERVRAKYDIKNVKFEYKESFQYFIEHFCVGDKGQREVGYLFWSALNHIAKTGTDSYQNELTKKFGSMLTPGTQQKFLKALSPSMKRASHSLLNKEVNDEQSI